MKIQNVLNLIKSHVQKDDLAFRNEAALIANDFDRNGNSEVAQYIAGLISTNNVFIPQAINLEFKWLTKVETKTAPLFLSEPILNNIKGIVNAVRHNVGVNKFLFVGKPGTGKTESAKQLARLLDRNLYKVDFQNIIDSKLGQTSKNIYDLFQEINQIPNPEHVVIFFDELDTIVLDRINQNDIREMGRVTSGFLSSLDELNSKLVLVAATNLFEQLDRALIRRFDATVNFDKYSSDDLAEIAIKILNTNQSKFKGMAKETKLFRKIIEKWAGDMSPGELKNAIRISLAFGDVENPYDYLTILFKNLSGKEKIEITDLDSDFTLREKEILTGVSKSKLQRTLKEN